MNEVKALVLRAAGINCDLETEFALEQAGAVASRMHINRIIENRTSIGIIGFVFLFLASTYVFDSVQIALNKVFGTEKHEDVQALKPNEMLMLSLNTSTTVGQITKTDKNSTNLSLKIPVVPLKGESIGIARNLNGHWRLIGFGEIAE